MDKDMSVCINMEFTCALFAPQAILQVPSLLLLYFLKKANGNF